MRQKCCGVKMAEAKKKKEYCVPWDPLYAVKCLSRCIQIYVLMVFDKPTDYYLCKHEKEEITT